MATGNGGRMIEEGESVEDVARREAMEEAGLNVKRVKPVLSYLASPRHQRTLIDYG